MAPRGRFRGEGNINCRAREIIAKKKGFGNKTERIDFFLFEENVWKNHNMIKNLSHINSSTHVSD